jgi:hypothetical protein
MGALSPRASLTIPVFLEVFSGTGKLSAAVSERGLPTLLWDITLGEEYDLMRNRNRLLILGWIQSRQVCAVHLGTPCQSFSRARDQPGGPPPLRSDALPLGLPDRRPGDQRAIEIGNALMVFSASVLRTCARFLIPATMENPGRSRIWLCPPIARLLGRPGFSFNLTEFCMWGMRWRKSTAFLATNVDLGCFAAHRCLGAKRGLCKRSGKPHLPLSGQRADGVWWTKVAEPYPPRLCRNVALAFDNALVARRASRFERLAAKVSAEP